PRELNSAITSSERHTVPSWLYAPTVMTQGALPGAPIAPYCVWPRLFLPWLPAAVTTTIPASTARFAARVNGSVLYDSVTAAPTERLMTRMLYADLFATAQSNAEMTLLMTPRPFWSRTFRLARCASGAIPARTPSES